MDLRRHARIKSPPRLKNRFKNKGIKQVWSSGTLKMNLSWLLPGGTCRRTSRGGRSGHRRAPDKPGPEREPEFRRRKSEKESAFFVQLIDRFDPKKRLEQQK